MQYYQSTKQETYKLLDTSPQGLTVSVANERLETYGTNTIQTSSTSSRTIKFISQFKDWMILLLVVSAVISFWLGEYRSGIVLSIIVLFNALIGFVQEYKAEKVMESLTSLIYPNAKVLRDGELGEIPVAQVVPGDIVLIEEGDSIPADIRLIQEDDVATNDFALTGESNPVKKFTRPLSRELELGERVNMAYMGTTVARGRGRGVVIATGSDTVLGQIAALSSTTSTDLSPLQEEINNISLKLTIGTLVVGMILFFVALAVDLSLYEAFLFALGIAMSLVPQGMPAQISIALSLASSRLSTQNVVVKKLSSVETLGSTTIICTDKTGTLTQNQMSVERVILGTNIHKVTGTGYQPQGDIIDHDGLSMDHKTLKERKYFFRTGVLASTAHISRPDANHPERHVLGDPTEGALITLAAKAGFDQDTLQERNPLIKMYPFDSERKRMSAIRQVGQERVLFVKGAAQSMIDRCTHIFSGGKVVALEDLQRKNLLDQNHDRANHARRQLVYAYRVLDADEEIATEDDIVESDLICLGMVSMIDPPRPEVHEAIQAAYDAHIRVTVITGDHALTATAIAQQVGLDSDGGQIMSITGRDLQSMSDEDIVQACRTHHIIFSRTAPQDKLRIVSALKDAGEVVAVTGDGINDAPALKKADIGVAMGITGTDVAKDASALILLQDNFSDLVTAIREGRIIFTNITKTIYSSLTSNGGELWIVLLSLVGAGIRGRPIAITPLLILCIDLVGEMLPLTALTRDPARTSLMTQSPRDVNQHLLRRSTLIDLLWSGFLMGLLPFGAFMIHLWINDISRTADLSAAQYAVAVTVSYISILFCQYANILSRRAGDDSIFTSYFRSNTRLLRSFMISLILVIGITYIPIIANTIGSGPLSMIDRTLGIATGIIYLAVREGYKKITASPTII